MGYVNYFNYTQMLTSIKEKLPESIDFIPRQYCVMLYKKLKSRFETLRTGEGMTSLVDIHNELLNTLCAVDENVAKKREASPEFFKLNSEYQRVLDYFAAVITNMPFDYKANKDFFSAVKRYFKGYKSPVSYISRLVITRMGVLNERLLGDFATNWNEDATDAQKSKIIALLIMRQFILQFRDGTIELPVKDGKGGYTISDKTTYIRLSDKGKKDKNGKRIATADDYWCPAIKALCEKNYGGDYERMAEGLSFEEFDELKNNRGCRLAALAEQFSKVNFGVQKKGRANMYIFALAFELTFNKPQLKETDINKCLFYDLFNNSFFVKHKENDDEAQGYGINYKNFVDITYLFYLNKDIDETGAEMTPALRLYRALNTIAYVKRQQKNLNNTITVSSDDGDEKSLSGIALSDEVKELVLTQLLGLSEDEFRDKLMRNIVCSFADPFLTCPYFPVNENYDPEKVKELLGEPIIKEIEAEKNGKKVTKKYNTFSFTQKKMLCSKYCKKDCGTENCSIYNAKGWTGAHLYSYEHKTAKLFYEFMNENDASEELMRFRFVPENDKNSYSIGSITYKKDMAELPEIKEFTETVKNIIGRLENDALRPEMKNEYGDGAVSRADLFAAYCRHIAGEFSEAKADRFRKGKYQGYLRSFSEFYDFFCSGFNVEIELPDNDEEFNGINSVLIKSNFQPVSYSSLFDIVAIYITYRTCLYDIYGE